MKTEWDQKLLLKCPKPSAPCRMQHLNALWDPGIWCSHLPKTLSLELQFYQTQVLLHSGNTDDREWELQRLKLPDLHIRPKPNARKSDLPVNLFSWKPWNPGAGPRGKFGVSFTAPHPLAPLDAATLKKPNPNQNKHYFGSQLRREGQFISTSSTNPWLKVQKSWTKACNANSTGDSSQSMNSSPKKFGWWKGRGWSHPKALLAHIFRFF